MKKILILTPHIYFDGIENFTKNRTGFAFMMNDIVYNLSKQNVSVAVLTQSSITKGYITENIHILKRTWFDFIRFFRFEYLLLAIKLIKKRPKNIKTILKTIFYCLSSGYVEKVISSWKPDVIHIHSLLPSVIPYIYSTSKFKIPYIVTIHALIPNQSKDPESNFRSMFESKFHSMAETKNISVTTVSTGMKNRIINKYKLKSGNNIQVITNGTNISKTDTTQFDLRNKYNIMQECEIVLCVGTIGTRKNQLQLLRAYDFLDNNDKEKLSILFIGNDTLNGELDREIKLRGLGFRVKNCGFVDKNIIHTYYDQADYNVLVSIDEGFGLSIIEGYSFGLPTLTFKDLDAANDLYHQDCMIVVDERTDIALSKGLKELTCRKWNRTLVKNYAHNFSSKSMAKKYIELYKNASYSEINKKEFYKLLN